VFPHPWRPSSSFSQGDPPRHLSLQHILISPIRVFPLLVNKIARLCNPTLFLCRWLEFPSLSAPTWEMSPLPLSRCYSHFRNLLLSSHHVSPLLRLLPTPLPFSPPKPIACLSPPFYQGTSIPRFQCSSCSYCEGTPFFVPQVVHVVTVHRSYFFSFLLFGYFVSSYGAFFPYPFPVFVFRMYLLIPSFLFSFPRLLQLHSTRVRISPFL